MIEAVDKEGKLEMNCFYRCVCSELNVCYVVCFSGPLHTEAMMKHLVQSLVEVWKEFGLPLHSKVTTATTTTTTATVAAAVKEIPCDAVKTSTMIFQSSLSCGFNTLPSQQTPSVTVAQ
jgi:hypothetical protein